MDWILCDSFPPHVAALTVSAANLLPQVAKAVSHSLNNCVNCLPGQKDVDMALKSIGEASKKLLIETVSLQQQKWPPEGFLIKYLNTEKYAFGYSVKFNVSFTYLSQF